MVARGELHQTHIGSFVEHELEQRQQEHGESGDQSARDQRKRQHDGNFGIDCAAAQNKHEGNRRRLDGGHRGADYEEVLAVAAAPRADAGNQHTDKIIGGKPDIAVGVIGHEERESDADHQAHPRIDEYRHDHRRKRDGTEKRGGMNINSDAFGDAASCIKRANADKPGYGDRGEGDVPGLASKMKRLPAAAEKERAQPHQTGEKYGKGHTIDPAKSALPGISVWRF